MIKLTGSLADSNRRPTDKQIQFELHEDLVEMISDGKYYFQNESGSFSSEIAIDGDLYVDIRKKEKKPTGISASVFG